MRVLVTGVAGFIGSHLAERLLDEGHVVCGVDVFTPYYDERRKRANLAGLLGHPSFELLEIDLRTADLGPVLAGTEVVFHQAGQPGVRLSWSDGFRDYVEHNVLATQRLLEASREVSLQRFVYASSSSVYGRAERFPVLETDLPLPESPYGVTKLAAEHLTQLYAYNFGVPTVSLRYFTVYGPRQRPDMAIQRLVEAAVAGRPFTLFGDGSQQRDFTYVGDVVAANLAAATAVVDHGSVFNVAGGGSVSMREVVDLVQAVSGSGLRVEHDASQPGDVRRTSGDTESAARELGWYPEVSLERGIAAHVEWYREQSA